MFIIDILGLEFTALSFSCQQYRHACHKMPGAHSGISPRRHHRLASHAIIFTFFSYFSNRKYRIAWYADEDGRRGERWAHNIT